MRRAIFLVLLALAGCVDAGAAKPRSREDFGDPGVGDIPMPTAKVVDPADQLPDVAKELGHKGGMIVLWPRLAAGVDPAKGHDLAGRVQQRLEALAHRAGGARHVEVRPEPEVRCPKAGCVATMISAIVFVNGDKCGVLAYAGGVGSPAHLLPWAGKFDLKAETFPSDQAPDAVITPKELLPCEAVLTGRENEEATLARYFVGALPNH